MTKFTLTIKKTTDKGIEVTTLDGFARPDDVISVEDLKKVIEVEQYLEKMFGLRFHINMFHKE